MNILLWILQAVLALFYFSGGAYKMFKFDELASQGLPEQVNVFHALPRSVWGGLGLLEMAGALLLIVPAATKWMPALTPLAATVLALESLGLAALYARYSLQLTATNPLVWSLALGLLVAFVAYGRFCAGWQT